MSDQSEKKTFLETYRNWMIAGVAIIMILAVCYVKRDALKSVFSSAEAA
jgi:hypothetical protein